VSFRWDDVWRCGSGWAPLNNEFHAGYMAKLGTFLRSRKELYPPPAEIFRAFERPGLNEVKVVILGQDPYADGKATGLAFSVRNKTELTPSLRNIYAAIEADLGSAPARSGDLTPWTEDGILLLNAILTVDRKKPNSHAAQGWERFTDRVVEVISEELDGVIFLLWGEKALRKARLVDTKRHYVLPAAHPQAHTNARLPLSRCRHFSLTNCLLEAQNREPIRWLRA
jgi:uracil-DNA glycosylase